MELEVAWNNVRDAYFDWCHMASVLSGEWDNYATAILIFRESSHDTGTQYKQRMFNNVKHLNFMIHCLQAGPLWVHCFYQPVLTAFSAISNRKSYLCAGELQALSLISI